MKFDFVIGNPPYQETLGQTEKQNQSNSTWIYQYFQFEADKIGKHSCLIYPFGGWFDTPNSLNKLGKRILSDKRTVFIHAYEGTTDKRAWFRKDKQPAPIFANNANLSAGVSIVMRDSNDNHDKFEYSNRIYTDEKVNVEASEDIEVTPNPLFININKKLGNDRLVKHIKKGIFNIQSDFVEKNPTLVSKNKSDWSEPVFLVTNNVSGSKGRLNDYYINKTNIPIGHDYLNFYKVIITSAYPKKSIVSSNPTIENIKKRLSLNSDLVRKLDNNSAFGRSRMALFMSNDEKECDNFIKYMQTDFFACLILQEPNRSSTIGSIIPYQDFSSNSDIHWDKSIEEINKELFDKYQIDENEINFLMNCDNFNDLEESIEEDEE